MTGFGGARCEASGAWVEAEARSVNHRGLHVKVRVPADLLSLEAELESAVRTKFVRGTISLVVVVREPMLGSKTPVIDVDLFRAYLGAARSAARDAGLQEPRTMEAFLSLPGVAGAPALSAEMLEERASAAKRAVDEALEALAGARAREGRALCADLVQRATGIETCARRIAARAPRVVEAWRERLARRMQELFGARPGAPAEEDLLREAALFAERSDIAEELTRLAAHLAHFRELLESAEPVGRRLDFLLQEMHREATTIGAKASDLDISRDVVELRTEVDRLKEQVPDIE